MTTIVAVQGDGWAVVGADSRISDEGRIYSMAKGCGKIVRNADYLFGAAGDLRAINILEHVFNPPPKVKSGVIRCTRNQREVFPCDEKLFIQIVKMSFNQRRKTIRNSIKQLISGKEFEHPFMCFVDFILPFMTLYIDCLKDIKI
jgi:hypothetical protein